MCFPWSAGLLPITNYFAVKKKELLVQVHKTKQITSAAGMYQWLAAPAEGFLPNVRISSVFILSKISNWSCLRCFLYKNVTRSNSGLWKGKRVARGDSFEKII